MKSKFFLLLRIFFGAIVGVAAGLYVFFNLPIGDPSFLEVIISIILGFVVGGLIYSFSEINCQERMRRKKAALAVSTKKE